MGSGRRIIAARFAASTTSCALACAIGAFVVGCHKDQQSDDLAGAASSAASTAPVDHLAPGELVEGTEKIFSVPLPRELGVERKFADVGYASGEPGQAAVASYFSTRVQGGKVTTGDRGAVFDAVHTTTEPNRVLRIEVATASDGPFAGRGSHVTIRDITAPKLPDQPNEEARWKAAGLKPDGTLLDPQHLK
jgi:hypothetical protein